MGMKRASIAALAMALGAGASAQDASQWRVVSPPYLGGGQAAMVCPLQDEFNTACIAVVCPADKALHVAFLGVGGGVFEDFYNLRFTFDGKPMTDIRFHRMQVAEGLEYYRELIPAEPRTQLLNALQSGSSGQYQFVGVRGTTRGFSLAGSKAAISKVTRACKK
ncbi:MAG: hypothetical protein AAF687_03000 [Pseudomonadota bacterium]